MRDFLSYSFLMPPTVFILGSLIGSLVALIGLRSGMILALLSNVFLYLFATPAVSLLLQQGLSSIIDAKVDFTGAQAIVVPAFDIARSHRPDVPDTVGELTLERLANAAALYRRLQIPILLTGGASDDHPGASAASLMRVSLEQSFLVRAEFTEEASHNTFEQALYSSRILKERGLYNVIVVAQARDIPRLLWSFERLGLHPTPSEEYRLSAKLQFSDILPSSKAFLSTFYVLHELIGLAYYHIIY